MARNKDEDRILRLLDEQGLQSNAQIKSSLNLEDKRFNTVREELINTGLIEKYRCRGGGIRLTKKGRQKITPEEVGSSVGNEKELYAHFIKSLEKEAEENEESALVCDTSALRMRGKWSNPDVTKLSIRTYPLLQKRTVVAITYEVKQWRRWNVDSVYEAASHNRFSHESYVVLEWADDAEPEGLEGLISVCSRFGIGLITLHKHYKGFRHRIRYEAESKMPSDDFLEEFLGYVFDRQETPKKEFDKLMASSITV